MSLSSGQVLNLNSKESRIEEIKTESEKKQSEKGNWEKTAIIISIISLIVSTSLTAVIAYTSYQVIEKADNIENNSLLLQIMQNGYTPKISVSNPQIVVLQQENSLFDNWTSPTECYGWVNGSINIMTPQVGTVSISISNFSISDDYSYLLPEKTNLTIVEPVPSYYPQGINDVYNVGEGLTGYNFSLPIEASFYPNPEKLPVNTDSIFPIGYLLLKANFIPQATNFIPQTEYFSVNIFVDVKNYP